MSAGKIIAYIVAAILIFFGVLFVWGATGDQGDLMWIPIGLITIALGLVLIFWAARRPKQETPPQVTLKVDLPANINLDTLKCKSCGGTLKAENIKIVAGAPVVTCPYCGTSYQLTEEPKW
ncbi:hypothetical protein [uncultured Thermanaerothrix sp.]|uniref:hypothetical protein n=1 Tax=uncultured Thermanaerothrix sp. TaxID=1195149 RepID=UPI002631ED08|nr:hypothetical protein [uncultured Thermanaerothrix sp.]